MNIDRPTTKNVNTSAHPADHSVIAAILADARDNPMGNKAVRVAHEVLRQVPGAAFDGDPFMIIGLARAAGFFDGNNLFSTGGTPRLV